MGRAKTRMGFGLDRLPVFDRETGDITVLVETPKGSRNKYKYDAACGVLKLAAVLAEGLSFPYDFGFVPSTLGEDGDPLDVLLFLDHAIPPGSVATARLIGVLEVEQREQKKPWVRNDRFFAVATHAHSHQSLTTLADLRPHLLEEIESFFVHYAQLNGKKLRVTGRKGPRRANKLLRGRHESLRAKMSQPDVHRESLEEEATHTTDEARMVLPGVQAIFGFQLMAAFNQRFELLDPH